MELRWGCYEDVLLAQGGSTVGSNDGILDGTLLADGLTVGITEGKADMPSAGNWDVHLGQKKK